MAIEFTGPSSKVVAVVPSNSTLVNCRGFYVGGAGDVAVMAADDSVAVTFKAVPVGLVVPVACKYIMATGTTATFIVALI